LAKPQPPPPSLLLAAVFSRHDAALEWTEERLTGAWGRVQLRSPRFDHSETRYYEAEMGARLRKQFLVFEGLFDPQQLSKRKLESNQLEEDLAGAGNFVELRPVNIDPGYLTLTKLVLASAKDRAHRLYMAEGIYAEECLYYLDGCWQTRPWTYADYKRADFQAFFIEARELLKRSTARCPE
jgi:Domain of unknown function (DUF4416)